jgi:hypothetical protein
MIKESCSSQPLINRAQTLDEQDLHLMIDPQLIVDWSGRASCARQMLNILTSDKDRCSLYVSHADERTLSLRRQPRAAISVREKFEQQFRGAFYNSPHFWRCTSAKRLAGNAI